MQHSRLLCISVITFCGIPLKFRSINITFRICLHGIDSTAVSINGDRQILPGTVCQRISSKHDLALTGSFIPLVICIIQLISLYCHVAVAGIRIIIQLQVFGNIYIFLLFCLSHLIRSILPAAGCKRHCHNGCQCDHGCFSAPRFSAHIFLSSLLHSVILRVFPDSKFYGAIHISYLSMHIIPYFYRKSILRIYELRLRCV